MKQHEKPCSECPFARACPPGMTGGSDPAVFVGQSYGPFLLSCHKSSGYYADKRNPKHAQCAGAAIFRANTGAAQIMPERLLRLPADDKVVFVTPAELIAHHRKVTVEQAQAWLSEHTPEKLLRKELSNTGVEFIEEA